MDDRLNAVRAWIGNMQARFSDYPNLYSGKYFEPTYRNPCPVDLGFSLCKFKLGAKKTQIILATNQCVIIFGCKNQRLANIMTKTTEKYEVDEAEPAKKPKSTNIAELTDLVKRPSKLQKIMFGMAVLGLVGTSIVVYNHSNGFTQNPYKKTMPENKNSDIETQDVQISDLKEANREPDIIKPENVLPDSMTPQKVLNASNATDRYNGWVVQSDKWFGKVNNIRLTGEKWRIFLSTIPGDVDIFADLLELPPDINNSDYIEVSGQIKAIRRYSNATHIKYIDMHNATVIKRNRGYVYKKFRPDYETISCVQKVLTDYGYYYSTIDGVTGPYTKKAVERFLDNSSILDELGLSKKSSHSELCNALRNISKESYDSKVEEYSAKVREKRDKEFNERVAARTKAYNDTIKAYNDTIKSDLDYLIESDNVAWKKANSDGSLKKFYEYLTAKHFRHNRNYIDLKAEIENSFLRNENKKQAQKILGITFDPNATSLPEKFINIDKRRGTNYFVKLEVEKDSGFYFQDGEHLHGKSVCLNSGLLAQCYADGICTKKDWDRHKQDSNDSCVNLDVYHTFATIVVDHDVKEELCKRFESFINQQTNHNSQYWIYSYYGVKRCRLHYSKDELNRIIK